MFKEEREESAFEWTMLGQIDMGRPNLGFKTDVAVYRLMQFTLRDVLIRQYGVEAADQRFLRGRRDCRKAFLRRTSSRSEILSATSSPNFRSVLKDRGIGILRVEKGDLEKLTFTLTVAEDLDCSGLPACGEQICTYDEGFISGLLFAHTGKRFLVKEVDCWCSGDRVCRFDVKPVS